MIHIKPVLVVLNSRGDETLRLPLPTTTAGAPILPSKGDMIIIQDRSAKVVKVVWNLADETVLVLAVLTPLEKEDEENCPCDDCMEKIPRLSLVPKENYHDSATLNKVYKALVDNGLSDSEAMNAINAMQNSGILFRERDPSNKNCPTCQGGIRRTVGMVCPTCKTDYAKPQEGDVKHKEFTFLMDLRPVTCGKCGDEFTPSSTGDRLCRVRGFCTPTSQK